jgi:uncharacterized protein YsxB (DUF464 family)
MKKQVLFKWLGFNGIIQKGNPHFEIQDYIHEQGVKAIFFRNSNRYLYKFIVIGETAFAEYGKDIVAAAISALTTKTKFRYKNEIIFNLPYIELELERFSSEVDKEKSLILIDSLMLGLTQLEEEYGQEYLRVIEINESQS